MTQIKYSLLDFEQLNERFDSRMIRNAQYLAINKVLPKLQTHISARVRNRYNVTARSIKERVKLRKASMKSGALQGVITFSGSRIGLINFNAKIKKVTLGPKPRKGKAGRRWGRHRVGVTVRVLKGSARKLVTERSGFIAQGRNGNKQIFYRQEKKKTWRSKGREVLRAAYQYSIPEMIELANGGVGSTETYNEFIGAEFNKEFDVAMNYYINLVGPQKVGS